MNKEDKDQTHFGCSMVITLEMEEQELAKVPVVVPEQSNGKNSIKCKKIKTARLKAESCGVVEVKESGNEMSTFQTSTRFPSLGRSVQYKISLLSLQLDVSNYISLFHRH